MKKYTLAYNPILEYWNQIERGEVIVGLKIRTVYKQLVEDMYRSDWEYEYRPSRAIHAIEFIENFCKQSTGRWGGKFIDLDLWQKAFIGAIFGFVEKDTGYRKYREVLLIVGRKNGKSTLNAAICLYMMVADYEPGAQVYAVATKKDQAKAVWEESKRMVDKSPELRDLIKRRTYDLTCSSNDSFFKYVGSDSNRLDGLNVHCASLDEIHAWIFRNLYDVFADGTSARTQPLILMITTAGFIRGSVYDMKYDQSKRYIDNLITKQDIRNERFLPIIYELDKRDEYLDSTCWQKANPGLGTIKGTDFIETKLLEAKKDVSNLKTILTKDFNIPETSSEAWLTFEQLYNPEKFDIEVLMPKYGIGGVDLSSTTDLTAAKIIFMVPNDPKIYVLQMYWLPEDLLEKRSQEDDIPYDLWYEQGLLRTTPGNKIHPKYVTEWFIEIKKKYKIFYPYIGYDAWQADYWVEEMQGYFGKDTMIPVRQGKQTLSAPMKMLGADLEKNLVVYGENPIDIWCLSNTSIEMDKNMNIQPHKGKNQRRRIDGTSALLNAYVAMQDNRAMYEKLVGN